MKVASNPAKPMTSISKYCIWARKLLLPLLFPFLCSHVRSCVCCGPVGLQELGRNSEMPYSHKIKWLINDNKPMHTQNAEVDTSSKLSATRLQISICFVVPIVPVFIGSYCA
jgi:hypothetical protein